MVTIADFPPNLHTYKQYLDKLGDRRSSPKYTISRTEIERVGKTGGCPNYQPGQYKIDRDFPSDVTSEVRKGRLTGSVSSRHTGFKGQQPRTDKDGILRGIRNPGNCILYHNQTSPGQYEHIDGMENADRVCRPSAPAYSQRKGEPQETLREMKKSGSTPGPTHYTLPSRFDAIGKQRQEEFADLVRRESKCRWEGQFGHIFSRTHVSARQGGARSHSVGKA
eukprot:TRINITY_DN11573_c0_g1_i1.p2 TRINITY_DN11573_c0_g1~~TRINITY_DN11573_c0_g1_i1.p2  ORF type:complete len:222 (-),score=31.28 TRINITY_DN11573_c0_g1_i1:62-727(-)